VAYRKRRARNRIYTGFLHFSGIAYLIWFWFDLELWTGFDDILCVEDYWKTRAWISMKCFMSTDVGTWTNWLTFEPDPAIQIIVRMPEPDCFLLYHFSAATRNFTSGKSDVYVGLLAAAARSAFLNMVLFTEPVSRRNTLVGGSCAPRSALLVWRWIISWPCHLRSL